ncbi:MAG: hypothetical protein ACFCVH_22700, partial [Alphaproteobacteria bacterium]
MRMVTLLFGLVAIAAGTPGANAEDRLTPMLRMVPQDAVAGGVNALVTFTDLTALRAVGLAGVPLFERFAWEPVDKEVANLSRASALPAILADYINYLGIHRFETTEDYLGFAWSDIELTVGYGAPPNAVTILQGTSAVTDSAAIDAALTARGFAAESRGGHDFWWRLEDNALDIPNLDPADPLRGHLGGSARAGIIDG